MGFFNFNKATDSSNAGSGDTVNKPVILQLNEESVTISYDDAKGKTIGELFAEYGQDLGDVERVTRYINAGQIVPSDTDAQPGTVYRGTITSETKGIA